MMGAGMAGGYALWRGTRWLRRGMRIVSFGLFAAGVITAVAETIKTIKNSSDRNKEDSGVAEAAEELRELTAENELLERDVEALRRVKTRHMEKMKETNAREVE